jgi:hypothetical protein
MIKNGNLTERVRGRGPGSSVSKKGVSLQEVENTETFSQQHGRLPNRRWRRWFASWNAKRK